MCGICFRTCCGAVQYSAVWAEPESFDEILVGAGMVSDHLPDTVLRALVSATHSSEMPSSQLTDNDYIV